MILRETLNDTSLLAFAVRLGDGLLQSADKSDAGYSWKAPASVGRHNLTGFSHGAAGVAYAMLELFRATGDSKYRTAAEEAFNYERHWFDAEAANWPDFREEAGRRYRNAPRSFAATWCHGAPGIALSRHWAAVRHLEANPLAPVRWVSWDGLLHSKELQFRMFTSE